MVIEYNTSTAKDGSPPIKVTEISKNLNNPALEIFFVFLKFTYIYSGNFLVPKDHQDWSLIRNNPQLHMQMMQVWISQWVNATPNTHTSKLGSHSHAGVELGLIFVSYVLLFTCERFFKLRPKQVQHLEKQSCNCIMLHQNRLGGVRK